MGQKYKLIVSSSHVYREFEIFPEMTDVFLGTESGCDFRLDRDMFFESICLELKQENGWILLCGDTNVFLSFSDARKLYSTPIRHRDRVAVCYASTGGTAFQIRFLIDFESELPSYLWMTDLHGIRQLSIGDDPSCDLCLQSPYVRNNRIVLTRQGAPFVLTCSSSEYGVNLNGKALESGTLLRDTDFFSLADVFFYYKDQCLFFDRKGIASAKTSVRQVMQESPFPYPLFVRSTRLKPSLNTEEIPVLDPSPIPQKPKINYLTSLLPVVIMFILVVVFRGILNTTGGTFVIFSICSMGLGVVTSVLNIVTTKKRYREAVEERRKVYSDYIVRKNQEITRAREEERRDLDRIYFSIQKDLENVEAFNHELFDRTPEDGDFLDIYLGRGRKKSLRQIAYKKQEKLEIGDELSKIPEQLQDAFTYLDNVPITLSLREAGALGVVGGNQERYRSFKNMLLDLSCRHYFRDVRIYALLGDDYGLYDWIRLLPHLNNEDGTRNIVCDMQSRNLVFEALFKELDFRSQNTKQEYPWIVVLVMDARGLNSHPICRFVSQASDLHTAFVFFESREEYLPLHCTSIIRISGTAGMLVSCGDSFAGQSFTMEEIPDSLAAASVRKLAPVYCEEITLDGQLRKSISLFELLGIYAADDLNLKERWETSRIEESMAVPLGVNVRDEVVSLDLHEKYHGPHGLVAGTTGSGKSEILQTFILGASTLFSPSEIGFLIIDFKGGGMANQFRDLPHLLGSITNIDGKEIDRSLKSIRAELLKRQTLFAQADVNHIDKYIQAWKEGRASMPLPHLVIIVDEFAELKAEQPDFMQELISTARIGRSLGVHLILATQKPAGQVNDQIWSNSRFRLCLKVQTQEDSNEVLKSPLAAEIKEPGRAYLQVGNNELFELFQSGFSGAPEKPDAGGQKDFQLKQVSFSGHRGLVYEHKTPKTVSRRNQLEAMVGFIHAYCMDHDIMRLPQICLPPLPKCIIYDRKADRPDKDAFLSCPVGIYDNPDNQIQDTAILTPGADNILIIGSAQFGKTNMLEQVICSLADVYDPSELQFYIIDFGSMVLKNFEKLNHVGGVVTPAEDEKLRNLFKHLSAEIGARREKLLEAGVSSFASYLEAGHKDLPHIVIIIDNLTVLKEMYLQDDDILITLSREGIACGLTLVAANAQTSGIGYRYLSNFSTKIALYCNDGGEYATLMGMAKVKPDEIPGRFIFEMEKNIYECQAYLSFEGEREYERILKMQAFVAEANDRTRGMHAALIPEIPQMLTQGYVFERFAYVMENQELVMGLDYSTVLPCTMELYRLGILGITGRENAGKSNYIRYLINAVRQMGLPYRAVLLDDYRKKLRPLAEADKCVEYCLSGEQFIEKILETEKQLEERYELLLNEQPYDDTLLILVMNHADLADQISGSKDAVKALKNIVGRYHVVNTMVIVGGMPNAPIPYGAPELYKIVKEGKNFMVFDDIDNCRIADLPMAVTRKFKKKIAAGDAFFITGNECMKLKTPFSPDPLAETGRGGSV